MGSGCVSTMIIATEYTMIYMKIAQKMWSIYLRMELLVKAILVLQSNVL